VSDFKIKRLLSKRARPLTDALPDIAAFDAHFASQFPEQKQWRDLREEAMWPGKDDTILHRMATRSNIARDEHFVRVMLDLVSKGGARPGHRREEPHDRARAGALGIASIGEPRRTVVSTAVGGGGPEPLKCAGCEDCVDARSGPRRVTAFRGVLVPLRRASSVHAPGGRSTWQPHHESGCRAPSRPERRRTRCPNRRGR
jgi:hypothetical protein